MLSYNQRLKTHADRRRDTLAKLRERGWTLARIGEKYGITRQRVYQILRKGT